MRTADEFEVIQAIKEKLKECKPEWLELNAKGQPALGVLTVQQILDNATNGVISWNFSVEKEWREEVNKFDKKLNQWVFDGYVYHVRGTLHIEGIGSRTQYGSKVAIGGKDNQNSSYKSAASDCLKKCASLFGVGSSIYSKIKIDTDDDYGQIQNNPNYQVDYQQQQYQPQQAQPQQPQQITLPNGDIQQGEYIWLSREQQWIHQSNYQANQGGHYPPAGLTQQYAQPQQTQHQAQQQGNNIPVWELPFPLDGKVEDKIEYPFNNPPQKQEQGNEPVQQNFQAQPQAEPVEQNFQAVQYGAPVEQKDPLAHVQPENPWNTPENMQELQVFQGHKERLGIKNDSDLLPHVREYFKDGNATIASVTPETLKGFNIHLQNIQV